jgi:3-oxocholest-4-en-26-oate---CoA ligase
VAGYKVPRIWRLVGHCHRLPTGKPDYRWAAQAAAEVEPA